MKKSDLKLSLSEKIMFVSQMQNYFESEIAIIKALDLIATNAPNRKIKELSTDIRNSINRGKTLYQALDKYSEAFGKVFMAIVKAGETSGDLDTTWKRLLEVLETQKQIQDKIILSLIYPVILIILAIVASVAMIGWGLPELLKATDSLGGNPPKSLIIALSMGEFLKTNYLILLMTLVVIAVIIYLLFQNRTFRTFFDTTLIKIPIISNVVKYINLLHFFVLFQVTYDAGIPIIDSLNLSSSSVKNIYMKIKLKKVSSMLDKGISLSKSLSSISLIPVDIISIISSGEETGKLGKMLEKIAKNLDQKVTSAIEGALKIIEPSLIVIIGIIVIFIAYTFIKSNLAFLNSIPM